LAIWSSLIALVGHITTTCVLLSLTPVVPIWRAATALAVFATGIAFWLWARALIGPLRVRRLPPDAPTLLRRAGPFGLVRNPMYLGVLVATWASTLAAGRAWLALSYAAVVVAVAVRAVQEERRLHEHLGDAYAEYSRAVKRLIPFVW
jgi:protein-S-isoprenylcysteine O-methyltransferase Ste14